VAVGGKEAEPQELHNAIEAACRGEFILCPIIAKKVLEEFGQDPRARRSGVPYDELTQRELQVLQLAANGLSNKELAGKLVISEKTVKNHTANIFSKLQVNDRTQAILYGLHRGLITMPLEEQG
jgi:DNA-binding NarL/FixJ family response regulator